MNAMQGVVAAVALGLAVGAQARGPDVDDIRHWSTPAFEIYSADLAQARTVAAQVAPIEKVLSQLVGWSVKPTGLPTHIYIAPESTWDSYLRPSRNIVAEFLPGRFANYILMDTQLDQERARESLNHEYSHFFLRSQVSGHIPLWFDEGLAEIAQTADLWSKMVRIGMPGYRGPAWIPLDKLLRADKQSPEYLSRTTTSFHFQSWALVHWGLFQDRSFFRKTLAYLQATSGGMPIEGAVQTNFGMSISELDRALIAYTKRPTFNIAKFPFEHPPELKLDAGRRMGELEGLELLARIMFDTGVNPARLGTVIAAAKTLAPNSPAVGILELRLAVRDGDDADVESSWRAMEPQAGDPTVARGVGLALFERIRPEITGEVPATQSLAANARRAFGLLARAEHLLPVDAESAWAFGLLSAWLNEETAFALQRLQLASATVPRNGDLSMALALLHERLEQAEPMREQLANTARYARSLQQRLWAVQRIGVAKPGAQETP